MHQDIATSFFNHAKALLQETKDERAIAYALGFINHFILDSECHNYIDTIKVEKQSSHFLIERDLDHRFIKINQDPINTNVAKSYTINLEVAKVIAPFFQLEPQVILKTLKSFRFNMGLFACKNPIKRKTILGAMTLARATKYKAMVMTGVFEPNLKENIDELVNKFNHAINIATKEIVEFYYSYLNDTEISNRFNYNYE